MATPRTPRSAKETTVKASKEVKVEKQIIVPAMAAPKPKIPAVITRVTSSEHRKSDWAYQYTLSTTEVQKTMSGERTKEIVHFTSSKFARRRELMRHLRSIGYTDDMIIDMSKPVAPIENPEDEQYSGFADAA